MKKVIFTGTEFKGYEMHEKEPICLGNPNCCQGNCKWFDWKDKVDVAKSNALTIDPTTIVLTGVGSNEENYYHPSSKRLMEPGDEFLLPENLDWEVEHQVKDKNVTGGWLPVSTKIWAMHNLYKKRQVLRLTLKSERPSKTIIESNPSVDHWGIKDKIIQAQIGTPDQSNAIEAHMKEYFTRWPNYKERFTSLEWYHIFLDYEESCQRMADKRIAELETAIESFNRSEANLREAIHSRDEHIKALKDFIKTIRNKIK